MSCAECVVFAFGTFREAADAILHPVLPEGFATAGDDLVGICLMAYVEDKLVLWRVVDVVEAHHEFDCSEA